MKKIFRVKGKRPVWKHLEYDDHGEYDTKHEAERQKRHLQSLGFINVCIKQRQTKAGK